MTSNGSLAYPAEYYYPEFVDNRPDDYDSVKSPSAKVSLTSAKVSLTSAIDNGTDLARKTPITPLPKSKPVSREQPVTYIPLKSPIDHGTDLSTKTPVITPSILTNKKQPALISSIDNGTGLSTKTPVITPSILTNKKQPALISSIDNGTGLSTKVPITTITTTKTKPVNKDQSSRLALDIATNQGLPSTDITEIVKTDPKKNLVRDPVERNIPRLIVDNSVIKQAVRTPRIITTNLDNINEQTLYSNKINNASISLSNGYVNGDLTKPTPSMISTTKPTQSMISTAKQQKIKHVEGEKPIDDYWKKEVHINDDGVVTIEPLTYNRETYEGPFGLTRQGSFIFYISLGIFTLLAGIFLIMTGIFYGQNYPSSSSNTGTLAGVGICALAFYLGLQLILIGLWHQKYRQENPKKIVTKPNKRNDSSTHLKTSMEENEPYNYSYQQPMDYMPYADYSNPPYISNVNEQMLYQQPNPATGTGSYDPIVQPSNVQVETQLDPKFLQPMDWSYGPQSTVESTSTTIGYTPATNPLNNNATTDDQSEKKHRHRHHHSKKTIEAESPKPMFDSIQPTSTVIEAPLPVLSKAPETNELLKSIVEAEKNAQQISTTKKHSNRVGSLDEGAGAGSLNNNHQRHRHSHRRRRHHHRRHRRHSCSSCSTCSNCSRDEFHSDVVHSNYHHQYSGIGTGYDRKKTKESGVTADLEDVPNVRDNRLEPFPVVRRTIIVEPYPAEPTSQILVKPQSNMTGKIRSSNNVDDVLAHSTTTHSTKISKKKKKKGKTIEDLRLEDVNEEHNDGNNSTKSKKTSLSKTIAAKHVKNAFYD